ncbi:MAG: hypothetical protein K9L24_00625 [Spirochaetia bacterium]|nr:hypothetical protein [Spirochaetia bacterium]MCF7946316.1 hypothetical protein [Spirochaetia bacterium]
MDDTQNNSIEVKINKKSIPLNGYVKKVFLSVIISLINTLHFTDSETDSAEEISIKIQHYKE